MNKQELARKIWESANKMRSKIEANEYKDYILGFIFYKYLSDKEVKFLKNNDFTAQDMPSLTEENKDIVDFVRPNLGYFIAHQNLFSSWLEKGSDFDVSDVRNALNAFSRLISPTHKKVFGGIFDTLLTGLSKLGESTGAQTKAILSLITTIKEIPMDSRQDYDVLGFIYEYLISMFAANAGKKAGEFYTPHEVSLLMSEIVAHHLKDMKEIQIYDPTSGSGSLLINIGRCVAKHIQESNNIKYYAQELKQNTYNLTRMNLIMRGILPDNIVTRCADTLEDDWPFFDDNNPINTYNPLYVDAVVSNPPYSQNWDPTNKESDPRYEGFGLAPKTKADYAFLLHDLYHLKPQGIMTIVLPHGVLFRGGEEAKIRKSLIERNHIDTIIGLPANIFYGTGIPTIIMVLKQKRAQTDILMVDASKNFIKVGKNNKLQASDIKRIVDNVIARVTCDKFSRLVSREEIRQNDYNLNIPRYVDSSEKPESWDIYASMFGGIPQKEIDDLQKYWDAFPSLRGALFEKTSDNYAKIKVENIKQFCADFQDVKNFKEAFHAAFASLESTLKSALIDKMQTINISKAENELSLDIFKRLEPIPLIDKYKAYQLLDNEWRKIAVDLEIIQTEGFEATTKVDPHMVIKKKDGKEIEVQEGWVGHILPFDLIGHTLLKEETAALKSKEERLFNISSEYEELLDSLSEEDKEKNTISEDKDAFVNAEVIKEAKKIKLEEKIQGRYPAHSYEACILKAADLIAEEKDLKAKIKKETVKLHMLIKFTIENLDKAQVLSLLHEKWITPLITSFTQLPEQILTDLSSKIIALSQKYATTYAQVEEEIAQTQALLSDLIDELTGSEDDMIGLNELKSLLKGA